MSLYLVTGGAGFIGSHIVEELVARRQRVRILDDFSSGTIDNIKPYLKEVDVIRGDIRSAKRCAEAVKGVDFILHQAALRSVPKSMKEPHAYNEVNIQGTLNLLQAAVAHKVKAFVLASSSSVYGDTTVFPEKEDFLPAPISPYALTKLAGEYYCKLYAHHYALSTVCLRYFNVFGPRQSLDDEYAVVVPKFITCLLHGEQPPIFGTGKQSRDFTFVKNVVQANLLACARPFSGESFNVASGASQTVLELVAVLNKILKTSVRPRFLPVRQGDVFKTWADLTQAKKKLRFSPKTDFEAGLRLTCDFFRHRYAAGEKR